MRLLWREAVAQRASGGRGGQEKREKKKSHPMLHKLLKGLNLFITRDYDLSDASINELFI